MSAPATRTPTAHAPRPAPAPPRSYHFPRFERRTLANGLRLVVAPVTKLPLVDRHRRRRGGRDRRSPTARKASARSRHSCSSRARRAWTARRSPTGSSASARRSDAAADWDVAAVSLTALTTRLPEALALVRDLLRAPTFPEREVARLREERLAELLQQLRRATRAGR